MLKLSRGPACSASCNKRSNSDRASHGLTWRAPGKAGRAWIESTVPVAKGERVARRGAVDQVSGCLQRGDVGTSLLLNFLRGPV